MLDRWPSVPIVLCSVLLCSLSSPVHADPPTCPPPCAVELESVFCIRVTDIVRSQQDLDRWYIQLEFLNWTGKPAGGLTMALNRAANVANAPGAPSIVGAEIDKNGRPYGPASHPPRGNTGRSNHWDVISRTSTKVVFGRLPHLWNQLSSEYLLPGVHAQVWNTSFDGILSDSFNGATVVDSIQALLLMIPGSSAIYTTNPPRIGITDLETIDDGENVLDGFVLVIDDWDRGEQISLNWFLLDAWGNNLGMVVAGNHMLGDQYAFGTLNIACGALPRDEDARPDLGLFDVPVTSPSAIVPAPRPLFGQNSGYDPPDNSNPNIDSARFFAEDTVWGVDTYPISPVPPGKPGAGVYFHVEPGAAVTADFQLPTDNQFMMSGVQVQSGVNLALLPWDFFVRADCNNDGVTNMADVIRLLTHVFPQPHWNSSVPCEDACDANDDGALDVADMVSMLLVLFPHSCSPGVNCPIIPQICSVDARDDQLGCENYILCP